MAKDRFIIRLIFSGILIGFGIIHMLYTIFSRMIKKGRIKKDLNYIRDHDIQNIIQENMQEEILPEGKTKNEIQGLLKNIYFSLYQKHNSGEIKEEYSDMEQAIDHILTTDILNIIEEKDKLLQEKDKIITMLEEKNEKFINDTVGKLNYIFGEKDKLLKEKDKLLKEKDSIIVSLHHKLQAGGQIVISIPQTPVPKSPEPSEPKYHYSEHFVNVNG